MSAFLTAEQRAAAGAWALGSYRRLDALRVPAFQDPRALPGLKPAAVVQPARLSLLPTALPRGLLPLREHLRGASVPGEASPRLRLSRLLRWVAAPLRFEPLNPYAVHRGVPSGRCLYPLRYLLLGGAEARVWAYRSEHHALESLGECEPLRKQLGEDELLLLGIAELWSLADKYGEFSPFPCALEAGMAQAQVCQVGEALGLAPQPLEAPIEARALCAPLEIPLAAVRLRLTGFAPQNWPQLECRRAGRAPTDELTRRFPRLEELAQAFSAGLEPLAAAAAPVSPTTSPPAFEGDAGIDGLAIDLAEVLRLRGSGNDRGGFAPQPRLLAADFSPRLLALARALTARRMPVPEQPRLGQYWLWLHASGQAPGLYDLDSQPVATAPAGSDAIAALRAALPRPDFRYNLPGFVGALLICAESWPALYAAGPSALRRRHLAAGALAQDFSLAAAALGLFARPLRMLHEHRLEARLGLPGPLVYTLLCGFNRSANPALELL